MTSGLKSSVTCSGIAPVNSSFFAPAQYQPRRTPENLNSPNLSDRSVAMGVLLLQHSLSSISPRYGVMSAFCTGLVEERCGLSAHDDGFLRRFGELKLTTQLVDLVPRGLALDCGRSLSCESPNMVTSRIVAIARISLINA